MATKFLEPGGDADFAVTTTNGFWATASGAATATDFVHGGHVKSIKFRPSNGDIITTATAVTSDTGGRLSFYIYVVALPAVTHHIVLLSPSAGASVVSIRMTSAGTLQLWNSLTNQIGSDGATLATGTWYRICLTHTIASKTVNRFEMFVNGASSISVTNAVLDNNVSTKYSIANGLADTSSDFRSSDHYVDNSTSLTDTGDVWVTAKRPNANGTTNNFNTQIGAGGSGYGTGHSPQVNERPLSTTNGWSVINAGSAITEEYNIEGTATGDIDISAATIIDYTGWVSAKALTSETASIVVNGATSNISLTTGNLVFTKIAGSTSYPAGTGTDIGIVTSTTVTTVSLFECGIIVAFIPGSTPPPNPTIFSTTQFLNLLGTGT